MSRIDALQIFAGKAGPELTPQQKRFNALIRQIGQARGTLAEWHDNIAAFRQAHADVLLPLQTELTAAQRRWAFALHELSHRPGWTKAERDTLGELVCETARALLAVDQDDTEMKALFAEHAGIDYETEQQEMVLAMKDMAEAFTGLDLGDDDGIDTDEDLFARMQQGMQAREAADAERHGKAAGRRKSPAQQRRETEAQEATQSVREVFRKLASALHPDRETDARQREVKTALMQKANQAYAANDLLTLLELQLQLEQIDAAHIANAGAERLKHYNKVLSEQLEELKAEIEFVEIGFCIDFGLEPGWGTKPRKLGQLLEQEGRELRAELHRVQLDMRMLADTKATKRWLKRQRQLLREADSDFDLL